MGVPHLTDVRLPVPARGEAALAHDATFVAWDRTFSALRDVANWGIDALNHAGAGLPRLPEQSLEELLVLPLSGDYGAIRQNATACRDVRDAVHTWGDNVVRLGMGLDPSWDGLSAAAFFVRLQALGLVARGFGELVGAGTAVFEEVAVVAERLGVRVERLLVELGKALGRLAARLLSKVGPAGWAAFAAELLVKGLDAVTDIVEDVRFVVGLVELLLDLRDTVRDWVAEQRERLELFAALPGLVRS